MDMFDGLMHAQECVMKVKQSIAERHDRRQEDAIMRIRKAIEEGVKSECLQAKVFFNANIWTGNERPDVEIAKWAQELNAKGYDVAVQMNYRQPVVGHGGRGEPCHMMTISWAEKQA